MVRRAARASVVTWLVLRGSLTLLGAVKAVTDGAMGPVASWLPGYLAYAAAYAVLGTPILVALIVQLCVASWVFRRLVDRAPAR